MSVRRAMVLSSCLAGSLVLTFAEAAGPGGVRVTFRQFKPDCSSFSGAYPSLSAPGSRVAFESSCNLLGWPEWPGNTEIFVTDLDGSNAIQVTRAETPLGGSVEASLSASAGTVAFTSFNDLVPGQNPDMNSEIFVARVDGSDLRQLTDTQGGYPLDDGGYLAHHSPDIDSTGLRVVFETDYDPTDGNLYLGHPELFIVNTDGTGLRRLTHTPENGASMGPDFDGSGRFVYFRSNADWTGQNPDRSGEVFRISVDTGRVEQVSRDLGSSSWPWELTGAVSVSASGDRIAIVGGTNGSSGFHEDAFLLDVRSGVVTRITDTSGGRGCWTVSLSATGRRLALSCDRDLVPGQNPAETYQIFFADLKY